MWGLSTSDIHRLGKNGDTLKYWLNEFLSGKWSIDNCVEGKGLGFGGPTSEEFWRS